MPPVDPGAVVYTDGAVSADGWRDVVARGIAAIQAGDVEKVVLARDVHARAEHPVDVRWAARAARRASTRRAGRSASTAWSARRPSCWSAPRRAWSPRACSPGTIRRTGDDAADLARAAILAHSSKDLEEHEYAVTSVAHALEPFCSSTNVPDVPFVLHLPNVLHLASDVTGVLSAPSGDARAPVVARARRRAAPDGRRLRHADRGGRAS